MGACGAALTAQAPGGHDGLPCCVTACNRVRVDVLAGAGGDGVGC
jgi:hypothetical protein